ncbi:MULTISPECIES: hypothetical protein [Yersinia]|uniref:DUF4145 domain-containing protein n=2 Tax=Yersinia bercovieri TaxID=634 RepID=A0A2G4U3Z0_YERBE|nr:MULTISPECIES: hypothetical protein [Yersinia]PHZ28041.1 hypothetical protein CS533_07220 [Yersinia bercovieri]QDW32525.1 hypothetical protein FFE93_005320 [Yersinia sp. KBS0713]QKJ05667.1 hypothetical protein HRK25_01205 [Yersinia bercovieri ATCC 43970]CFQ30622.1 Uncharacterised protein [Yersinia bercovieri]CNJ11562.1 Uncharacterised protein [Yersinia bercovieri]
MDFFTFISKIIDSIAWPVVVFLILYYGRDDILKLVRTLKSIKVGDQFEAIFSDEAEKLAQETSEVIPDTNTDQYVDIRASLLAKDPRAAIMEAWIRVEKSAFEALERKHGQTFIPERNPITLIRKLVNDEILNTRQANVLQSLRLLRNQMAHNIDVELAAADAESYIDSAVTIISYLDSFTPKPQ